MAPLLARKEVKKTCAISNAPSPDEIIKAKKVVRNCLLAAMMLGGIDNSRYRKLKDKLLNDCAPAEPGKVVSVLKKPREQEVSFTQTSKIRTTHKKNQGKKKANDKFPKKAEQCFQCGGEHWIYDCKEVAEAKQLHAQMLLEEREDEDDHGHIMTQVGAVLGKNDKGQINEDWVLLDSQSTMDICRNPHLLNGIHNTDTPVHVYCNAEMATTSQKAWFGNFHVLFNPEGVANVLLLKSVKRKYYDIMTKPSSSNHPRGC